MQAGFVFVPPMFIGESEASPARAGLTHSTHMVATKKVKAEAPASHRVRIKIRAYDHKIIDQSTRTIIDTAQRSGASVVGPIPLPTEKKKWTVNRSTFVHKNAREQFEMRIHKRIVDIVDPNAKTIDALTSLNLPAGVDVEIKM